MKLLDPTRVDYIIDDLLEFLTCFNEPSIAQFISQKVVIIVDPYPERNRARQMGRNEDGDALRARLPLYPHAQFIVYYTFARLFGWPLYTVPYTEDGNIDQEKYTQNLEDICNYFGEVGESTIDLNTTFAKPASRFVIDNSYPLKMGVYK